MGCFVGNGIVICSGDYKQEIIGRTNKRWCFHCPIHIIHDRVLFTEILKYDEQGNLINGYYEPFVELQCRKCKENHTRFPGW